MNQISVKESKDIGKRVDLFLSEELKISRNQILNLIKNGCVSLNSKPILKGSAKLGLDDVIDVKILESNDENLNFSAEFEVPTLYEDDDLIVLNKPPNLVVHPAPSVKEATLVDWLGKKGFLLSTLSGESRAGIVHRLDKGTSGAIVVAKNNRSHVALSAQLSDKTMGRIYLAITDLPLKEECVIERKIGRNPNNRLKKAITIDGRSAKSAFLNLIQESGVNLIAAKLFTGRTHQIRVHLASINRHILGDTLYGFKSENDKIKRVMLHAYGLYFTHPNTGKRMEFVAPLWDDFNEILFNKFNKEIVDEKIDFKRLDAIFGSCNHWLCLA
ncbi:RluA family pseudouridine synthase [Campylobacter sp. RM16187]|uniref:RluA family pseudouridine synthase n=1 Tax=Campylobacter sp. RM16187 TaxID=1660063 RepID=UPI0021B5AFC7|nr:RluA family pseudouridine synthase [Campylobacter sp. RM16187]QKG28935.1 23S rRNA pseudouridine synthase [Campylobacter sp. RM16187]